MSKAFFRKIAFGLGPNDEIPSDPLSWAQSQFDEIHEIDLMGAPSLSEQIKLSSKMRETEDNLTVKFKHSAVEYEEAREINWRKHGNEFYPGLELHIRHKAALQSKQPAFERMFHFWTNHFAVIDAGGGLKSFAIGPYQREVIRKNLTGSFSNLVKQATIGYAMLESLDNGDSIGPNSTYVRQEKVGGYYNGDAALNENHARELLELHTVSPAAGYTQEDVIQLSKVMTGWKANYYKSDYVDWKNPVKFDPFIHEPKEKKILGKTYNSKDSKINAKDQLFAVIDDLCASDHCRRFISTKLCKYFIDDNPSPEVIQYVMDTWKQSDGDLPTIHKAVVEIAFKNPQFNRKFLMPETWWLQASRMLDIEFLMTKESTAHQNFKDLVKSLGEGDTILSLKELAPVRLIKNEFYASVVELYQKGASSEELRSLLGRGRAKKGIYEGDLVEGELEIGQISALLDDIPTVDTLMNTFLEEYQLATQKKNF